MSLDNAHICFICASFGVSEFLYLDHTSMKEGETECLEGFTVIICQGRMFFKWKRSSKALAVG